MTRNAPRTRDPREIETELEHARARMSDTLDLLESRLSLGALFDQAWNYVRTKNDGHMSSNLKDIIARNPLPVTLMGVGLAWLMMSGRRGSVGSNHMSDGQHDNSAGLSQALQAEVSSRTDNVTHGDQLAGVDELSPENGQPGSTEYASGRFDLVEPDDDVAEGLDDASPTSKKAEARIQESSLSTSGPSDRADEGLGGANTTSEKRT